MTNELDPAALALLPCPFCGGEPQARVGSSNYSVFCRNCFASTPIELSDLSAHAAWNRRTAASPAVPEDVAWPSEAEIEATTARIAKTNGCDRGTFTICWAEAAGDPCTCKIEARIALHARPTLNDVLTDLRIPQSTRDAISIATAALAAERDALRASLRDWREGDKEGVVAHWHECMDSLAATEARVKRLEEAMEPFAQQYDPWMDKYAGTSRCSQHVLLTFGDIRRARAALDEATK